MRRAAEPLAALTGLRAIAAIWVLAFHMLRPAAELFPALGDRVPVISAGYAGVDVFFVLSGFILGHAYAGEFERLEPRAFGRFLWLRLARVWPLHAFITVGLVIASIAARYAGFATFASSPLFRVQALPAHLALVHAWGATSPSWNVPSWSVSCEWFAYIAFPILGLATRRVRRPAILVGIACASLAAWVGVAYRWYGGSFDLTYDGGLPRVFFEFTAGVLLERATRLRGTLVSDRRLALLLTVVAAACSLDVVGPWLVVPIAAFVVGLARSHGRIAASLSRGPLVWLGERSYALYLVHGPLFLVARGIVRFDRLAASSWLARGAWLVTVVAITFALAAILYRFVEQPARARMRAWWPGEQRTIAASPSRAA